jgi:hypothetical protein
MSTRFPLKTEEHNITQNSAILKEPYDHKQPIEARRHLRLPNSLPAKTGRGIWPRQRATGGFGAISYDSKN